MKKYLPKGSTVGFILILAWVALTSFSSVYAPLKKPVASCHLGSE